MMSKIVNNPVIPPLNENIHATILRLVNESKVDKALKIIERDVDKAMQEQVELCEIPAPTFKEEIRAKELVRRMKVYGLQDVTIDGIGNVIGVRKGKGNGPVLAIGAHMDTVFPEGTDVTVRREGNIYYGPGIGDNCSGLRALLQVLRALNEADIQTEGDIWFVGTVGEEGNGDIRGSKYLFNGEKHIDGFVAIDSTDPTRILMGGTGTHRWRFSIDGVGGHSFSRFGQIPSAIHAMCRAGCKVSELRPPKEPKTTFTIGTIKGGSTVNTIAAHCEVEVDIRSFDPEELLKLEAQIFKAFEEAVKEENDRWDVMGDEYLLKLTKEQIGDRPAGNRPGDCPVLQCARSAQKYLGIELKSYVRSSTDANAPMSKGIPATCLCSGGYSKNAHSLKESFEMRDTHLGPELILLTTLALVGTDEEKAILPILKAD